MTTGLEALKLKVRIRDGEAEVLGEALSRLGELRELDLSLGNIGEAGVIWGQLTKVERLRLSGSVVSERAASLCESVRGMTRLRHLDLKDCRSLLEEGFFSADVALEGATQLETLDVNDMPSYLGAR